MLLQVVELIASEVRSHGLVFGLVVHLQHHFGSQHIRCCSLNKDETLPNVTIGILIY